MPSLKEHFYPALGERGAVYQIGRNIAAHAPSLELFAALKQSLQAHKTSQKQLTALDAELDLAINDAAKLKAISQDYTRLFIGPNLPAPLWVTKLSQ